MNYGGPVWHLSVSKLGATDLELLHMARRELAHVGDSRLGEWVERGQLALHLRRRLAKQEQALIGEAVDMRHTAEAWRRYKAMEPYLNEMGRDLAMEELTSCPT